MQHDYGELVQRQNKILGNMLGCEIDFIIKGLDNASRSVVASRKDAMYKKRQIFYLPDANGNFRVCEDRIVQARVIAVAHSCYDNRLPGKKDEVSFVVTRIDADRNVAVGLISRIIKQNI